MSNIERYDISEEWAHSGIIKAGDFCYLSYCVGNIGGRGKLFQKIKQIGSCGVEK